MTAWTGYAEAIKPHACTHLFICGIAITSLRGRGRSAQSTLANRHFSLNCSQFVIRSLCYICCPLLYLLHKRRIPCKIIYFERIRHSAVTDTAGAREYANRGSETLLRRWVATIKLKKRGPNRLYLNVPTEAAREMELKENEPVQVTFEKVRDD